MRQRATPPSAARRRRTATLQGPAELTLDVKGDAEKPSGSRRPTPVRWTKSCKPWPIRPRCPTSDAAALTVEDQLAAEAATSTSRVSTRAATHVRAPAEQFDSLMDISPPGEADPRVRLSWRFKATSAAYRMPRTAQPDG